MISQGLLIPSSEDTEFAGLEEKIILHNKAFGELSEDRRRFCVYYLLEYPKKGMKSVAERTGLSKSLCYELAQDPELMAMMISAAQAISSLGDLRCSIALDMLADEMCTRIAQGYLTSGDITPTMLKILEAGKTRLGLNPAAISALKVSMTDKNGNRTEVTAAHCDNVDSVLSELKARQMSKSESDFEAEFAEIIQPQSHRQIQTGNSVQISENGAKSAENGADLAAPVDVQVQENANPAVSEIP